jgi:acyl-ACP thioesterase
MANGKWQSANGSENYMTDNIKKEIIDGQQPDGRYCRRFTLGATEVDLNNRLRLQALLGMFQETAGDQCEQFGSGWSTLWTQHGLCYVVVRMEVRMERYPGTGERIRIDTWPDPKLRLIFTRYGEIYSEDGERLGAIVSQWALLDVNARTFVRPDPAIIVLPDTSTLTAPFELRPGHRGGGDCPCPFSLERAPVYSDFDYNGHMNNARYAEWTADTLWQVLTAEERSRKPAVRRLMIQFRTEIPAEAAGREIALEGGVWPAEGRFTLVGSNGKTVYFDSEAEFENL